MRCKWGQWTSLITLGLVHDVILLHTKEVVRRHMAQKLPHTGELCVHDQREHFSGVETHGCLPLVHVLEIVAVHVEDV